MKALRSTLAVAIGVAALLLTAAPANAAPAHASPMNNTTCSSGDIASGTYNNLTIDGVCAIPDGAHVTVRGHLTLTPGSELQAVTASTVMVSGNVLVGQGAKLALGCSAQLMAPTPGGPAECTGLSHDQVNGSIVANQPLTLRIYGITIRGSLVSMGGGVAVTGPDAASCESLSPNPLNFPVKDNVINGSVHISGWQGCWFGFIRNVQHGSTTLLNINAADSDANEIVTNTIHGSLVCLGNSPAPQVGDSHGEMNMVTGRSAGQCASL